MQFDCSIIVLETGSDRLARTLAFAIILLAAFPFLIQIPIASAHFYGGQSRDVGGYSIVFVPSPDPPLSNRNNTSLNFSVLQGGDNIYNIQAALTVKDADTGKIVGKTGFVPKEFSDVSFPFVFPKPGSYQANLQVKIIGDKQFDTTPLSVDFNVSAFDPKSPVPFDELMLLYVTPAAVAIGGLVVYLHSKNKI